MYDVWAECTRKTPFNLLIWTYNDKNIIQTIRNGNEVYGLQEVPVLTTCSLLAILRMFSSRYVEIKIEKVKDLEN